MTPTENPSTVSLAAQALRSVSLPDVFDAHELARRLDLDAAVVRRALRQGRLPGRRIGRSWVISRSALLAWLAAPERHDPGHAGLRRVDGGCER